MVRWADVAPLLLVSVPPASTAAKSLVADWPGAPCTPCAPAEPVDPWAPCTPAGPLGPLLPLRAFRVVVLRSFA
ncbi:MAG: hypothetical protein E6F93_04780 [Actinobacteria bacterium]|nr:MAG: hypothetical protein E6F93_04780 [Actinomycetota bacterium]